MAAEIEQALGEQVSTRLVEGSRGVFDVRLDGEVVFSKKMRHRFPDPGELATILQQRLDR